MNNDVVLTLIALTFLVSACGGRDANPVAKYQPGDEDKTCHGLVSEISFNEDEMIRLYPDRDKTASNTVLGATGVFLIIPWFFMDFSGGDGIELTAYDRRNQWLRELGDRKDCDLPEPKIVIEKDQKEPEPEEDEVQR